MRRASFLLNRQVAKSAKEEHFGQDLQDEQD